MILEGCNCPDLGPWCHRVFRTGGCPLHGDTMAWHNGAYNWSFMDGHAKWPQGPQTWQGRTYWSDDPLRLGASLSPHRSGRPTLAGAFDI